MAFPLAFALLALVLVVGLVLGRWGLFRRRGRLRLGTVCRAFLPRSLGCLGRSRLLVLRLRLPRLIRRLRLLLPRLIAGLGLLLPGLLLLVPRLLLLLAGLLLLIADLLPLLLASLLLLCVGLLRGLRLVGPGLRLRGGPGLLRLSLRRPRLFGRNGRLARWNLFELRPGLQRALLLAALLLLTVGLLAGGARPLLLRATFVPPLMRLTRRNRFRWADGLHRHVGTARRLRPDLSSRGRITAPVIFPRLPPLLLPRFLLLTLGVRGGRNPHGRFVSLELPR